MAVTKGPDAGIYFCILGAADYVGGKRVHGWWNIKLPGDGRGQYMFQPVRARLVHGDYKPVKFPVPQKRQVGNVSSVQLIIETD